MRMSVAIIRQILENLRSIENKKTMADDNTRPELTAKIPSRLAFTGL